MPHRKKYVATLVLIAAVFLVLDMWGHISQAYHSSYWIDIVTHLLFGAWLALILCKHYWARPLLIVTIVFLVGYGWELFEFARDTLYAAPRGILLAQHGWDDGIKDVFNNVLGALAGLWTWRKYLLYTSH